MREPIPAIVLREDADMAKQFAVKAKVAKALAALPAPKADALRQVTDLYTQYRFGEIDDIMLTLFNKPAVENGAQMSVKQRSRAEDMLITQAYAIVDKAIDEVYPALAKIQREL